MSKVYVIGSLRNPAIPQVAEMLRSLGHEVFDDWYAAGPEADDYWQKYERAKGSSFAEALAGFAAQHVFAFDKKHLDACDIAVMVMPAGKSAHLELGYCKGLGKQTAIFMDKEPERFDVMYNFADKVCTSDEELIQYLSDDKPQFEDTSFGSLNPRPFPTMITPREQFYADADADNEAAPVAPAEPAEGWVLVPKRMTQEMRDVTDSEGWTWEDLLAEAGSISQEEYAAIAAAPVAPADGWEHLKVYGYAPGDYMTRCHVCGAIANGVDKRAVTCRPCAEATHADAPAELPTTRSQRMRDAGFTRRPTWHSLPGDDEPTPTAPPTKSCATCKGCDGAYAPASFGRDCTGYQRERG